MGLLLRTATQHLQRYLVSHHETEMLQDEMCFP